jgi:hypothetical protein
MLRSSHRKDACMSPSTFWSTGTTDSPYFSLTLIGYCAIVARTRLAGVIRQWWSGFAQLKGPRRTNRVTDRTSARTRRSKREISATPYHRRGTNRSAYWACAGQRQGRRKRARRTTRPLRKRLALRESGARSTPPNSCRPRRLRHCAPMAPKASLLSATFTHQTPGIGMGLAKNTTAGPACGCTCHGLVTTHR